MSGDELEPNSNYVSGKEKIARLFHSRPRGSSTRKADRLPPGQRLVSSFPVLDLGVRPTQADIPSWKLVVDGAVEQPMTWTLDELKRLPNHEQVRDFHCVTRWSSYDHQWKGVLLRTLAEVVKPLPDVGFVVFHSFDGYTTNISLEEALTDEGMVAWELDEDDLHPLHGGPIRALIPQLYGWKSAKFLNRIEFLDEDNPGFWEVRGYHNHGDPWQEERYS